MKLTVCRFATLGIATLGVTAKAVAQADLTFTSSTIAELAASITESATSLPPLTKPRLPAKNAPDWHRKASDSPGTISPDATTIKATESDRRKWQLATAIIKTDAGWGSGAVVTQDGHIITNYHVVELACQEAALSGRKPTIQAILPEYDGDTLRRRTKAAPLRVVRLSPQKDLALLQIQDGIVRPKHYFEVNTHVPLGGDCYVVGSAGGGIAWSIRRGTVSAITRYPDGVTDTILQQGASAPSLERVRAKVIVSDCSISGGDSGGPIVGSNGALLGITYATPRNWSKGSMGYHIHADEVLAFCADKKHPGYKTWPWDVWNIGEPGLHLEGPRLFYSTDKKYVVALGFSYVDQRGKPVGVAIYSAYTDAVETTAFHAQLATNPNIALPADIWGLSDLDPGPYFPWMTAIVACTPDTLVRYPHGIFAQFVRTKKDGLTNFAISLNREDEPDVAWRQDANRSWTRMPLKPQTTWRDAVPMSLMQQRALAWIAELLRKGSDD